MHFAHTEGGFQQKPSAVHHRLRLLCTEFRVGSFGKLLPVLGQGAMLITRMSKN